MIYLITGTPGMGKTSFLAKAILENREGLFKFDDGTPRPIFTCNIPWTEKGRRLLGVSEVSKEDVQAASIHDNFPEGSVLIVDEASEVYPSRAMSSKLPKHVEGLNTLRHKGYTLILITQMPHMIDSFVQKLVFKHWHLHPNQLGQKLYEFLGCQTSFGRSVLQMGVGQFYKPDPQVFDLYHSSTKHIKTKRKLGWKWYLLPTMPVLIGLALWLASDKMDAMSGGVKPDSSGRAIQAAAPATASPVPPGEPATEVVDAGAEFDYVPLVEGRPETAIIYDGIRKVQQFPVVSACVSSAKACNCYTQQGTKVAMTRKMCLDWLENRPFNPYTIPERERQAVPSEQPAEAPSVLALDGKPKLTLTPDYTKGPSAQ